MRFLTDHSAVVALAWRVHLKVLSYTLYVDGLSSGLRPSKRVGSKQWKIGSNLREKELTIAVPTKRNGVAVCHVSKTNIGSCY